MTLKDGLILSVFLSFFMAWAGYIMTEHAKTIMGKNTPAEYKYCMAMGYSSEVCSR